MCLSAFCVWEPRDRREAGWFTGRQAVVPRVDSALFTGCHELVWLPPETAAYTRRGDGKERCTILHRGNFLCWPSVLWPNDAEAIQPSLNLRLNCHGAMPRAVSPRYNPNGEAWKSLSANGPPSMPPWMNGPLFLANVNDLYICPLDHPGLIFHILAFEMPRFLSVCGLVHVLICHCRPDVSSPLALG